MKYSRNSEEVYNEAIDWVESTPSYTHGRVDILSDGELDVKDLSLVFRTEKETIEIPVAATETINIYSSVVLDTEFLKKAQSWGITVNVFDGRGRLTGRFLPAGPMKAPQTTIRQLQCYAETETRLDLAKKFVLASLHHSKLNIRYYRRTRDSLRMDEAIRTIETIEYTIRNAKSYEALLLAEARARETYYSCFDSFLMAPGFVFDHRSRRPPQTNVNAMLSFGNVVLYNLVAAEINKTPLDIRVGFLHAANTRDESLNLDLAEIFKPLIVDRAIFTLINRNMIRPENFHPEKGGIYMDREAKELLLHEIHEKMSTVVTCGNSAMSYRRFLTEEVRKLVRYMESGTAYEPFTQGR